MGRIDDLIQQYCPEGVEYVPLSSVCQIRGRIGFRGYTREDQVQEGFGALSLSPANIQNGQMEYSKGTYITWDKYDESPEIKTENGDIIFCKTASVGKVALVKNLPYKATINPQFVVLKEIKCNSSFLTHYLGTDSIQRKVKQLAGIGSVPNLSQKALGAIEIPLPPLPVQEAIVEILDKFDRLSAELQAELQARKQQYEYYRNQLLTRFAPEQPVTEYSLGELGTLTRGRRFVRDDVRESGQPCIHYGDMYTYYGLSADKARTYLDRDFPKKMRYAEKGDVVIVGAGENDLDIGVGMVWEGVEPAAVHDACYILQHNINPKFIAHYLRTSFYHDQIRKYVNSAKICSISAENIGKAKILVPSMDEQARIVAILDKFEALVNDLSQGLPAEIAAVQEQYEYYRNQLLTFKTKE